MLLIYVNIQDCQYVDIAYDFKMNSAFTTKQVACQNKYLVCRHKEDIYNNINIFHAYGKCISTFFDMFFTIPGISVDTYQASLL